MTKTLISASEVTDLVKEWRRKGDTIALVPTMGALHDGHLDLIRQAKSLANRVLVSIFVNPTQFGPNEDFALYPRTMADDMAKLTALGVDGVFSPTANEMYPQDFQTWVSNDHLSLELCGKTRPGHFRGVCTVVMKLFQIVQPTVAIFGKKDYQQLMIIKRMVADLCLPVEVVGCETIREEDGLAMSSRNRRLDSAQRAQASAIFQALSAAAAQVRASNLKVDSLLGSFHAALAAKDLLQVEYAEIRTIHNLMPVLDQIKDDSVLLTAVKAGSVRLIDNMELRI